MRVLTRRGLASARIAVPIAATALLMAACGSGGGDASSSSGAASSSSAPSPAASSSEAPAPSDGTVVIPVGDQEITVTKPFTKAAIFVAGSAANYTWSAAVEEGALAAAEANGVDLTIFEANFDPVAQFNQVQNAITSGQYQGLIIQPVSAQMCDIVGTDAVAQNIMVVSIGATLCGQDDQAGDELWSPGTLTFIGGQYGVPGFIDFTSAVLAENPGPQKVIEVIGPEDYGTTRGWKAATAQTWQGVSDFEVIATVYTDFSTPDAYNKTLNALQANPDATIIVSQYIDLTKGVVKAVEDLGRDDIVIYDFAGSAESVKLVQDGKAAATFPSYPKSIGSAAVQAMIDAVAGQSIPKAILKDGNPDAITAVINMSDIGDYTPQF